MKATIEFNLPEDEDNFKMATRGAEYWSALYQIKELWRTWKHKDDWTEQQWQVHDEIMTEINEILDETVIGDIQ